MNIFQLTETLKKIENELLQKQIIKIQDYNLKRQQKIFSIDDLITKFYNDVNDDWDMVISVTGYEGSGKSTLIQEMCMQANKKYGWVAAFPYDLQGFINAIRDDKIKIISLDEAIKELFNRRSMSSSNQLLIELMTKSRNRNKIIFLAIPRIKSVDVYIRRDRAYMWLHVIQRNRQTGEGKALVFFRNEVNIASEDPFYIDKIDQVLDAFNEQFITEQSIVIIDELLRRYIPSYIGMLKYVVSKETIISAKKISDELKQNDLDVLAFNADITLLNMHLKPLLRGLDIAKKVTKLAGPYLEKNDERRFIEHYMGEWGLANIIDLTNQLEQKLDFSKLPYRPSNLSLNMAEEILSKIRRQRFQTKLPF